MATSVLTLARNAITAVVAADATIRTLCNRTTGCIVAWSTISAALMPVIALSVSAVELDGIDDPHTVLVILSAMADGARGIETAEALAQRARELVGDTAVVGAGVQLAPDDVSQQPITDSELVPPGRSRVDLTVRYRAEVL